MRVAAIRLEPVIGDVAANLERCEWLADAAAAAGAAWIVLPELFTTRVAFREDLAGAAVASDGAATALLRHLARRHGATVGGSFLYRYRDGGACAARSTSWSAARAG
jgi:predicted amidohydrolase